MVQKKSQNKNSRWKGLPRQVLTIGIAAVIALAARSSLADHYVVPSGSMLPTVLEGDRIVVDKLAYGFRIPFSQTYLTSPHLPIPGEVVVLISPETGIILLKRIVAGPGDTIEVREGRLILNGQQVEIETERGDMIETLNQSSHPVRITRGGGPDFGPLTIPADQYLVMGDNRGNSHDGREFGLVTRNAILGRAVACYFSDGSLGWRPL